MKRKVFMLLIIIFSLFIPVVYAKDMQYEVLYKMENELKDNTFTIQLGLREERTMAVMNSIVYNQDKLEFVSIDANEYFHVTKSKEMTNGVFKSFKLLADSDYGFQKVYYANVTFKIKDNFKQGERTEIYFSGNKVATADEEFKTAPGMTFTVFYDKDGTVSYVAQEQNFMTQINMYLTNNWRTVLFILGGIIVVFILLRVIFQSELVREYRKKHEHNHIVENMKFAKVPNKLNTVIDEKPEKVKIAKLGKWGKKNKIIQPNQQPVQVQQPINNNIVDLMKAEPTESAIQQSTYQEKGVFIGNQNTGDDNMLPDDFSTFAKSENNYAYDDDNLNTSEVSSKGGVNLDNLTHMSLQDDDKSGNGKIGIFLAFLLVIGGLFNIGKVNALDANQMDNLRNMILGNMAWSAEYDINNDNVIDMLDIIALKDINNITIIQDTMTVADSKPQATFNLKSTSKYVRTTRNGTTKVRTTAKGNWKQNPSGGNGGGGSTTTSGDPSGEGDSGYEEEITTVQPSSTDLAGDSDKKVHVSIHYAKGSGQYNEIDLPYGGSVTFDVYPQSDGYQKLGNLYCNNGRITADGYKVTISDVTFKSDCNIAFTKSNTINASLDVMYEDDENKVVNLIKLTNQQPDFTIEKSVNIDTNNYNYRSMSCNGGFITHSLDGKIFNGKVGETSGTCTIHMSPKIKNVKILYNGSTEFEFSGTYHTTYKNAQIFNSNFPNNLKLYCGGNAISPKQVKYVTQNIGGTSFGGYQYLFDIRVENDTCELR